ncbi:MAG TPA: hypothetical protein VNT99_18620 [Methylomirabilota bacterium]|nr:hypothetical protein [Methylomirabilota bacterium]
MSGLAPPAAFTLVCFAVPFEAKPFIKLVGHRPDLRVVVSGMGATNAARSVEEALRVRRPACVFTCGLAGALNPELQNGDVVFETANVRLAGRLQAAKARNASFHCATRVAITSAEKAALRRRTNADAVEMESDVIQRACAQAGVPCATVRAISDEAGEDLPLDFNALMTADYKLGSAKLLLAIVQAPQRLPALIRLGRNSARAAHELSRVLRAVLADAP